MTARDVLFFSAVGLCLLAAWFFAALGFWWGVRRWVVPALAQAEADRELCEEFARRAPREPRPFAPGFRVVPAPPFDWEKPEKERGQ